MSEKIVQYTDAFSGKGSSVIQNVFYDSINKELWVTTHNNGVYGYKGVPEDLFVDFDNALSAGAFWNYEVKGAYHTIPHDKVTFEKATPKSATVTGAELVAESTKKFSVEAEVTQALESTVYADSVQKAIEEFHKQLDSRFPGGKIVVKKVTQHFT